MPDCNSTTNEIWKPVVGYEGWYEVSNFGNVKRIRPGKGTKHLNIPLRPNPNWCGCLAVPLCKEGIQRSHDVHRLVMLAFVGPRPQEKEINHINGNRQDNRWPENLEYVSRTENMRHAVRLHLMQHGEAKPNAKLNDQTIQQIRQSKGSLSSLAAQFGVDPTTIWKARVSKTWRHVPKMPST